MLEPIRSWDVVIQSLSYLPYVKWIVSFCSEGLTITIQLPESIKKFLSSISDKKDNRDILCHCKRELIQEVWKILLNDEFVDAYKNGIIVECFDGILRRVYPRIFTYSADYPEK